jgi:hypothetical protein
MLGEMDRRRFLGYAGALGALGAGCSTPTPPVLQLAPPGTGYRYLSEKKARIPGIVEDLSRRTFRYFWETTDAGTGLAPDRYPSPSACSIAAIGFALTAYAIGAERGYITPAEARQRTVVTLRFLRDLPQGPQATGVAGYKGFYYHFIEMSDGLRAGKCELSTVDTALLLCGALHVREFFDSNDPLDVEIRTIADELTTRVDWRWAQTRPPSIALGWSPEEGFLPYDWRGYNEAAVMYLLALGHPTRPVDASAWSAWSGAFQRAWSTFNGQQGLHFPPLFGHQYSSVWVDFRGIRDGFMRRFNDDYFENARRATYAQRAYAILNPKRWQGYDADVWGLTACDGPADILARYQGELRRFRSYAARGAGGIGSKDSFDDGTIAPTAAAASIGFAPEIAVPAIETMVARYGKHIYSTYGFLDAFNPSFRYDVTLKHGKVIPEFGWVASDYLAIDQGPILAMIANFTEGSVWQTMTRCAQLRRGLQRAGFNGGWLDQG